MEIEELPREGAGRRFAFRGEFDIECIPEVERVLFNGDPSIPVIIEAGQLSFMDSTGLWILLRLARAGDDGTPGVVIRNPSQAVRRLINVSIPAGVAGLEVEFRGAGPGAAHHFTELTRSTRLLLDRAASTSTLADRNLARAFELVLLLQSRTSAARRACATSRSLVDAIAARRREPLSTAA
jgi:anti-anti-sigma factor